MAHSINPHLFTLERSLRDSLQKETVDNERQQKAMELQKETWERKRQVAPVTEPVSGRGIGRPAVGAADEGDSKTMKSEESILTTAHAREEAIEKRKLFVKEKVQFQLNRVSHEARKLDELRREVDSLEDPTKKEVAEIRKKIESVDRELKPLQLLCARKEKELREAVEAHNEKTRMKTDLVMKLMEIVTTSEKVRMQKLDELHKHLEAMETNGTALG